MAGGLVGIAMAVRIYLQQKLAAAAVERQILADGWRFDPSVSAFMGGPGRRLFDLVAWFDATVVDGIVNRTGRLARDIGGELRSTQSGLVRSYAAYAALGAVALIAWFLVRTSF